MGITVRGIRLDDLRFGRDSKGAAKVNGKYALISTADKVLATQPFNEYGGIDVALSPATVAAMDAFERALKADVHAVIGLEGAES
jgi:hypothetical protein